jgi:hypothetical protein
MSPDLPQASPLVATVNVGDRDRRSHRRYSVEQGVHYEVFRNHGPVRSLLGAGGEQEGLRNSQAENEIAFRVSKTASRRW